MKKQVLAITIVSLLTANAFAVEPYIQAQVGQSNIDVDLDDDNDTYYGIGVGVNVSENLAFEAGYKDFGEASESAKEDGVTVDASVEATAFTIAAVGKLPLGSSAKLFGKIGLDIWETETTIKGSGLGVSRTWSDSDDGADLSFAVGAAFDITESTDIHIEYQLHKFEYQFENEELGLNLSDDADVDVIAVGLNFSF